MWGRKSRRAREEKQAALAAEHEALMASFARVRSLADKASASAEELRVTAARVSDDCDGRCTPDNVIPLARRHSNVESDDTTDDDVDTAALLMAGAAHDH